MCRNLTSLCVLLLAVQPLCAQMLPKVNEVDWPHLREHCRELLRGLDISKIPLPADTVRALGAILDKEPTDADEAVAAVQKLLDPMCLIGVNINPESRVKAARGPAGTVLQLTRPTVMLIRVHNEGGVTSPLAISGVGLIVPKEAGGWLEAATVTRAKLSGQRLEYVAVRLTPREAGKREVTFRFDVGQGTQDLGFRAEVPILFAVQKP